jgi:hypothetical protein
MSRPTKPDYLKKSKQIKINVSKTELEIYNVRKLRLLEYSPTLTANDILRLVINNIDDLALVQFLHLDKTSMFRVQLLNDFLLTHTKTEKD